MIERVGATLLNGSNFYFGKNSGYAPPHAGYVLKTIDGKFFNSIISDRITMFNQGSYQALWVEFGKDLKRKGVRIYTNSTVKKIHRSKEGVRIWLKGKKGSGRFDHAIFTADLALLPRLLDKNCIHKTEEYTYRMIDHVDYRSYLFKIKGLEGPQYQSPKGKQVQSHGLLPHLLTGKEGVPNLVLRQYEHSNIYVVYAFGGGLPNKKIVKNIKRELERYPGVKAQLAFTDDRKPAAYSWLNYYPHVGANAKVFMENVWDFQGRGGLWTTGEVFDF